MGATDEVDVDVRVIAATNRPLESLVQERRFREDLFYRLNVIPVHVPPLRERREDIELLAHHFLERLNREMGKQISRISTEAMDVLVRHSWPGNVRELENVIERAVALETTPAILAERLPDQLVRGEAAVGPDPFARSFSLDDHLKDVEAQFLRSALARAQGNRGRAAELLGVTPRSLRYLLSKHRVPDGE